VPGTWSAATVSNTQSNTYTFTPASGQCANDFTLSVTVGVRPSVTTPSNITVYHNEVVPAVIFQIPGGTTVNWTNSNTGIGLTGSGTGNIPAFTAVNNGDNPVVGTITVTASNSNCQSQPQTFTITVLPLTKEVYVPNMFTPNGDGKNDILKVYGNYISKLEMRIFNQWGEQVILINDKSKGWDGLHKGKPQPTGVYVYVLKATLSNGTIVSKKGSVSLLR
jgi:gliding motility-associated-like protein